MADDQNSGNTTDENDVSVAEAEQDKSPEDIQEQLKKVIKVSVADAGVLRKKMTVSVPRESIDNEQDSQYQELISDSVIPGFRRGRAPRRLVEKRFGREVGEQVTTKIVSNAYMAAIDKEEIKVLGDPLMWVTITDKKKEGDGQERLVDLTTALRHMRLPDEGPFEFRCEVEVKPEFELPELDGIAIEKPTLKITDDDVSSEIDRIRARRGNYVPVIDGKVEDDDLLICDLRVTVDGEEVKTAENIQVAARPQWVEGVTFEDFGKKVKGCKTGDKKVFKGKIPTDYDRADLRGKEAEFEFTLNDIKRMKLPEIDKAYMQALGFESEKEYRAWVKESMEGRLQQELQSGMRRQIAEQLLTGDKFELPEGLSTRQTERTVTRRVVELRRKGVPQAEIDKHADELRTGAREQAVNELKLHFILEEIAEKLEIKVTEEEINGQIAAIARAYGRRFDRVRDELGRENGLESLYLQLRDDKCLDHILEKAKITEAEVKPKAAKKKDSASGATKKKTAASKVAKTKTTKSPTKKKKTTKK